MVLNPISQTGGLRPREEKAGRDGGKSQAFGARDMGSGLGDFLRVELGDTSIKKIISILKELISLLRNKEKLITIHLSCV